MFKQIQFEGPKSKNPLSFKHYEPEKLILGKCMKDWLRFSVCFWHSWGGVGNDMFGEGTRNPIDFEKRIKMHFDFLESLSIKYYCFHDRDISPSVKKYIKLV